MSLDAIVVGSGPAGAAAAAALLRRGRKVLMLDGGLRLEPERQVVVEQMAQSVPSAWSEEQLAVTKEGMEPGAEGIPLKRLFGSDFSFREAERFAKIICQGSDVKMSLAFGGMSNVWGAGAPPFCADDISDWPLTIDALAPYYRECLEEMPLSASQDDLTSDYPLYKTEARALRSSRQAAEFLADLERHRQGLGRQGIRFGLSRLAVRAAGPGEAPGCVYCGLCLYGCPYGYIYNSADAVKELRTQRALGYQPDVVVERISETTSGVSIHGHGRQNGEKLDFAARQVFLACGAISSTAILLESLEAWDKPLAMKDSQYFIFPVARFNATPGVEQEQLHTLAQVFLEIRDPQISAKGIHLSVYTFNDLLLLALKRQAGLAAKLWPGLPGALARRLLVFGGYLHSNESPGIQMSLSHAADGGRQVFLQGTQNRASAPIMGRLLRKLARNSFHLRAVPLVPLARRGLPGRGFHFGGSFPMLEKPGPFQSDLAGRPHGFAKVHVVDATVFPSIPAPNLTLTVMANARRIAALACQA